jgi:hypothetical protein
MKTTVANILKGEKQWIRPLEGHQQLLGASLVGETLAQANGAVQVALRMGDMRLYCERLFELGEYDRSVAAAPAVSHEFWLEMMRKRAKVFDSPTGRANALILCGRPEQAVELLLESGKGEAAFLTAAAQRTNDFGWDHTVRTRRQRIVCEKTHEWEQYRVAAAKARWQLNAGQLYPAAMTLMSVSDVTGAEFLLLRHGQTATAFLVDRLREANVWEVQKRFAMMGIQLGFREEVFSVLDGPGKLEIVIAVCFPDFPARVAFYREIGLEHPREYATSTSTYNRRELLHRLLLTGQTLSAVCFFLTFARANLATDFCEVRELALVMEVANLESLAVPMVNQVVCIALYFAAYQAIWKGYAKIFGLLESRILAFAQQIESPSWFAPFADEAILALRTFDGAGNEARLFPVGHRLLRPIQFGSSHRPPNSDAYYFSDDLAMSLSLEEALMWFDLTPCSPFDQHVRHYIV